MIQLSFDKLARILKAKKRTKRKYRFCGVSIDTRTLQSGNLFIALLGEHFDGHDFIDQAQQQGASCAIVSRPVDTKLPCLLVENTLCALGKMAAYWRRQFDLPLIAVTGSNGKTTVKNMIASIFLKASKNKSSLFLSTHGNLNNQIGLPLNLFRLNEQHHYAVVEMGMSLFGEIAYLTQIARPNVAIITNAYPAHLEGVGDMDGVAKAKAEIFKSFKTNPCLLPKYAILNKEDKYYSYWKKRVRNHNVMTFSLESKSNVYVRNLTIKQDGSQFTLCTPSGNAEIYLPLLGQHNVINALAATAACLAVGITLSAIKAGLEAIQSNNKRLFAKTTKAGFRIIDDSYNANPASLRVAIDVLAAYSGKKILVLGDMKELGKQEKILHKEAGEYAKSHGVDYLLAIGELTQEMVKAFGKNAKHFGSKQALNDYLKTLLTQDTIVLVKGSRSMQMEDVVVDISKRRIGYA